MIKRLFSSQINSITAAAFLVAAFSLASRILGLMRDRILAGQFGAGDTLDIYYAAFRIPDLIFNLLILGSLSAGFIPVFTSYLKNPLKKIKDYLHFSPQEEAWTLANNVLNLLALGLLLLGGLGIIFSDRLIPLITPGFTGEKLDLTIKLSRIMFLSPVFLGISSLFGGILQSCKNFFAYSLAPLFYNAGIIAGVIFFVPLWGAYGLAWGVVLGAFLHLAVQLPAVLSLGFKYRFKFNWRERGVKKIFSMMIPRTLTLGVTQLTLLLTTIIASILPAGSLAILNLANNIQSLPVGIFGIAFATAAFPALSASAEDKKTLIATLSSTLRQILFFIVPATVVLIALRAQITRVILGTGKFGWQDTILTFDTLGFFAVSLFSQSLIPLLVRAFYARGNSRTPFFINLISAFVYVFLAFYFALKSGVAGLALAFSSANILNLLILWIWLRIDLGRLDEVKILAAVTKFSLAALAAALTVQGMKLVIWPFVDMTKFWGVLSQGLLAGLFAIFVYLAVCSLLRSEETIAFWAGIRRRLPWRKIETGDQSEVRGI